MVLFAKLFDETKIRRYFNSDNQYSLFSTKTLISSNYFYFYKNRVGEIKKWECLNYIRTLFVVTRLQWVLIRIVSLYFCSYKKIAIEFWLNFQTLEITKKDHRRMRLKNTFDKGAKKTKSTKWRIVSSSSPTDLTKLKSLIKCCNQPGVPLGQSYEPKSLRP